MQGLCLLEIRFHRINSNNFLPKNIFPSKGYRSPAQGSTKQCQKSFKFCLPIIFLIIIIKAQMNFLCHKNPQNQYYAKAYTCPNQIKLTRLPSITFLQQSIYMLSKASINELNPSFSSNRQIIHSFGSQDQPNSTPTSAEDLCKSRRSNLKNFEVGQKTAKKQEIKELLIERDRWIHSENNINTVVKMIHKGKYQHLFQNKNSQNTKWIDPQFQKKSTYSLPIQQQANIPLKWIDIDTYAQKRGLSICLKDDDVSPYDIVQGRVGDCYFMSALASLATCKDRIDKIFSQVREQNGIYIALFMVKGITQQVIVDSYFPTFINKEGEEQLLGCKPNPPRNQIYPMILQKCWAKLNGSYEAIDGGHPHQALNTLSGAPTKRYILNQETSTQESSLSFFNQIKGFIKSNYLICAGTSCMDQQAQVKVKGNKQKTIKIQKSHIYSIVNDDTSDKQMAINIYNPWGHNICKQQNRTDGIVKIQWNLFKKKYQYVTVCKISDNANYLYVELEDCKPNKLKFIELQVKQVGINHYCAISLSQTRRKKINGIRPKYIAVTFIVLKEIAKGDFQFETVRTQQIHSTHYLELNNLTQGKYLIALLLQAPEINQNLTFGVYSEAIFGFSEKKKSKDFQEHFISKVFLGYDKMGTNNRIYPIQGNSNVWISFQVKINKSKLGYLLLHVDEKEKRTFQIAAGKNTFTQSGISFYEPYNGEVIRINAKPGYDTIAIASIQEDEFNRYIINQNCIAAFLESLIKKNCTCGFI